MKAGRQAKNWNLKDQLKQRDAEIAYLKGLCMGLQAQLSASKMERPPDLDEWIETILPDMDPDERAEWDALTDAQKEALKDSLGEQINTEKLLLAEYGPVKD